MALAAGYSALGISMVSVMGVVAAFVAITNICVPSIICTLLWGQQRASAPTVVSGL